MVLALYFFSIFLWWISNTPLGPLIRAVGVYSICIPWIFPLGSPLNNPWNFALEFPQNFPEKSLEFSLKILGKFALEFWDFSLGKFDFLFLEFSDLVPGIFSFSNSNGPWGCAAQIILGIFDF